MLNPKKLVPLVEIGSKVPKIEVSLNRAICARDPLQMSDFTLIFTLKTVIMLYYALM